MPTVIIEKPDLQQLTDRKVFHWPVWEKDPSRFDWEYEGTEECYILEGEVIVETDHGMFTIKAGDFVTFEDGLKCSWDIKKSVRKHYNFR
jgi:uncharacterized cupin superfamily protein